MSKWFVWFLLVVYVAFLRYYLEYSDTAIIIFLLLAQPLFLTEIEK